MTDFWCHLLKLVEEKPWVYRYLSDEVKSSRALTEAALKSSGSMLEFAPNEFKQDKELVLIAVDTGDAFIHASEQLQHDKEVILKALEWDSYIIEELDEDFYEDLEIMYKAIGINAECFEYLAEELQGNRDIALACVKLNCDTYDYLSEDFKKDTEIIETAINGGLTLRSITQTIENPSQITGDRNFIVTAINNNDGNQIQYATNELRNDAKLAEYAIEHELHILSHIGEDLRKDKSILRKYFKSPYSLKNPRATLQSVLYIPRELILEDDFMLELIADNEYVFQSMYRDSFHDIFKRNMPISIDVTFCKRAYQVNPKTLKFMGNNMKKSVKD